MSPSGQSTPTTVPNSTDIEDSSTRSWFQRTLLRRTSSKQVLPVVVDDTVSSHPPLSLSPPSSPPREGTATIAGAPGSASKGRMKSTTPNSGFNQVVRNGLSSLVDAMTGSMTLVIVAPAGFLVWSFNSFVAFFAACAELFVYFYSFIISCLTALVEFFGRLFSSIVASGTPVCRKYGIIFFFGFLAAYAPSSNIRNP